MRKNNLLWLLAIFCTHAVAGVCELTWDGDKLASISSGRPLTQVIRLNDSKGNKRDELTVAQISAVYKAKEGIRTTTNKQVQFQICADQVPNAFAASRNGSDWIGITAGMVKFINGDQDLAAALIGHEYAHHLRGHATTSAVRDTILDIVAAIAGIAIDVITQDKFGFYGFGQGISGTASALATSKFDRDQEREADEDAIDYMTKAGFNPDGAVRLFQRFAQVDGGDGGWFFDSHPGSTERVKYLKEAVAKLHSRQQEQKSSSTTPTSINPTTSQSTLAALPSYEISDSDKAYQDGIEAIRRKDFNAGLPLLKAAAASGNLSAQIFLGASLDNGKNGLEKNSTEAFKYYKLAADQNNSLAQAMLGTFYVLGKGGMTKDHSKAIHYYKLSADQGNPTGQALLGSLLLSGTYKDTAESKRLCELSAQAGNTTGQYCLGVVYENGTPEVQKDLEKALNYYKLGAAKNSQASQWALGRFYETGKGGLNKDLIEAGRLYKLSADQGFSFALAALGRMYDNGIGGFPKNQEKAVELYKLSANTGNSNGQAFLAQKYQTGSGGLKKDEVEAVRLYKLASEQNNSFAKNNLGAAYEFGQGGLKKDIETAVRYYKEAEALGSTTATNNLKRLGRQ